MRGENILSNAKHFGLWGDLDDICAVLRPHIDCGTYNKMYNSMYIPPMEEP